MGIKKSKTGRKPVFEESFKSAVCMEILSGNLSYSEARKKYAIRGCGTLFRWVKQYQDQCLKGNLQAMNTTDLSNQPLPESQSNQQTDLQQKTQQLEEALKMAQLKIMALETMIDIAESELNIDIRKKSGTKQ